jgi:hypothetical protein
VGDGVVVNYDMRNREVRRENLLYSVLTKFEGGGVVETVYNFTEFRFIGLKNSLPN